MCNFCVPDLITFWLSLSSTEFDKSSPFSGAGDFLVFKWSISTGLPSNSVSSEPLEKSIGASVSSSNIPNDTKTEYCLSFVCLHPPEWRAGRLRCEVFTCRAPTTNWLMRSVHQAADSAIHSRALTSWSAGTRRELPARGIIVSMQIIVNWLDSELPNIFQDIIPSRGGAGRQPEDHGKISLATATTHWPGIEMIWTVIFYWCNLKSWTCHHLYLFFRVTK